MKRKKQKITIQTIQPFQCGHLNCSFGPMVVILFDFFKQTNNYIYLTFKVNQRKCIHGEDHSHNTPHYGTESHTVEALKLAVVMKISSTQVQHFSPKCIKLENVCPAFYYISSNEFNRIVVLNWVADWVCVGFRAQMSVNEWKFHATSHTEHHKCYMCCVVWCFRYDSFCIPHKQKYI